MNNSDITPSQAKQESPQMTPNPEYKKNLKSKVGAALWQIHQYSAIALLLIVALWYLSSKEVVNPDFLVKFKLMPIATILLVTHVSLALRAILLRYRIWNTFAQICIAMLFITLIFDYSSTKFFTASETTIQQKQTESTTVIPEKTFTLEELAAFDGKNGKPAYVAIDNLVYDLSPVFINGSHFGHKAGIDLTTAFKETHFPSVLKKYFVVGRLVMK
jgi:predicted heme/steroid binding protein